MVGFVFGYSGQQTSEKCAETAWNYQVREYNALKITFFVKDSEEETDSGYTKQTNKHFKNNMH